MWTMQELKIKAKTILPYQYWKTVLVTLVFFIVTAGYSNIFHRWFNNAINNASSLSIAFSFIRAPGFASLRVIALLVTQIIMMAVAALTGAALFIFIFSPIQVGCLRYYLDLYEAEAAQNQNPGVSPNLNVIVFIFKHSYKNVVKIQFLRSLFIFLWSLLLVIPGIIKAYEYRMIPFLLAENPSMGSNEAFARSKEMMMGEKWNTFVLDLSFIGWYLLSIFTCGILMLFYVSPYYYLTCTGLYLSLKNKIAVNTNPSNHNPYYTQY